MKTLPLTDVEDVVISGISGRYPNCSNIQEFWDKLCQGVELSSIDNRRWPVGLMNLPERAGRIPDAEKFDNEFFGLTDNEANWSDPSVRIFHETTYEAILDAGITPESLKGPRTGVFIGWCYSDSAAAFKEDEQKAPGFMQNLTSRLSTTFGFKGIALGIDTACASSFNALNQGLLSIRAGECDSAIIGGITIHLSPSIAYSFARLNMISKDGRSKCMDASADGYCRSEAIVSVLLQKKSVAKRSYATVVHSKTNTDGYKVDGITFPSMNAQMNLMKEVYSECGVDPGTVDYVEAHMTGTAAGDPVESEAIASVLCTSSRKEPLPIGCVKSNMGHAEGASGLCAISKACLIFQRKKIPPNLHLKNKNPMIKPLMQGILRPVTSTEAFEGSLIALNCFGFGGCNVHVLLKANEKKEQVKEIVTKNLNRLVFIAGRTKESLECLTSNFRNNPNEITTEYLSLLEGLSYVGPRHFEYRAWMVLDSDKKVKQRRENRVFERKSVWLFFSGLNSFLENKTSISSFSVLCKIAEDFKFLNQAIESYTMILSTLFALKRDIFEKTQLTLREKILRNSVVNMIWVDLLRELGVSFDGFVGCSIGEVVALYAEGSLDVKQTLIILNAIGSTMEMVSSKKALDLIYCQDVEEQVLTKYMPNGVYILSSNTVTSFTVAVEGNVNDDTISKFLDHIERKGGNVKKIGKLSTQIHSSTENTLEDELFKNLNIVLKKLEIVDKHRNILSTSVDQSKWNTTQLDAAFFTGIITNPINLSQVLDFIPKDAVMIEFGCDDQYSLTNSLKRGVGPDAVYLSIDRKSEKNCSDFLELIGEIYLKGINPQIEKLYPKVSFPVSNSTASISHLLKWNHSKDFLLTKHPDYFNYITGNRPYSVDILDRKFKFLVGHCLDGRVLFPATGYLWLIWTTFAQLHGHKKEEEFMEVAIEFESVSFSRATIIPKQGSVTFIIQAISSTGQFAIIEGGSVCVTGVARICKDNPSTQQFERQFVQTEKKEDVMTLTQSEIYKELRVRGYDYGPTFQGLIEATADGSSGKVKWLDNFISFSDSLLQLAVFSKKSRDLHLPTFIEYIKFDIVTLMEKVKESDGVVDVLYDLDGNIACAPGFVMKGIKASAAARRNQQKAFVEESSFQPYHQTLELNEEFEKILAAYDDYCCRLFDDRQSEEGDPTQLNLLLLRDESLLSLLHSKKWTETQLNEIDVSKSLLFLNMADTLQSFSSTVPEIYAEASSRAEKLLRIPLDIVIENLTSRKDIDVLEIKGGGYSFESLFCEILGLMQYQIKYMKESLKEIITLEANKPDLICVVDPKVSCFSFQRNQEEKEVNLVESIEEVFPKMKEGSFMLVLMRTKVWRIEKKISDGINENLQPKSLMEEAKKIGFIIISQIHDPSTGLTSILLRKPLEQIIDPKRREHKIATVEVKAMDYTWIPPLRDAMLDPAIDRVYVIAKDSLENGVVGLVRCLRKEEGGHKVRCIFAPGHKDHELTEVKEADLLMNVLQDGKIGSYRHLTVKKLDKVVDLPECHLDVETKGDLSSLKFYQTVETKAPEPAHKYAVYYSALNFKDVMVASGRIPTSAYPADYNRTGNLGMEFSGIDIKTRRRVMGIQQTNAIASFVTTEDDLLVWEIPSFWSLSEAATVPVVYLTVYYSLLIRGKVNEGESILIHAGTGGVGQAAIRVALAMGCEVFTTVGTNEKREFVKQTFPSIDDQHIFNSRDTKFEEEILRKTHGRGVDIILNSLSEDKMTASFRCLAPFGRFLEIGKYDLIMNSPFDVADFQDNKSYHSICIAHLLDDAFNYKNSAAIQVMMRLKAMMSAGIASNEVRPIPSHIFDRDSIEEAFRFMASGKHMGKVLIQMRNEKSDSSSLCISSICKPHFDSNKSFIVTGGLGGFGLELCHWLVESGVTKLIITSRSGIKNGYQKMCLKRMQRSADIVVSSCDMITEVETEKLIKEANEMGPVGGIFHLAMVLNDAVLENQTPGKFAEVCASKVSGTHNLDRVSRRLCPSLDFFVCFSSLTSGRGNAGQTNYGFANSFLEKVCERRRKEGFHGLAIQWGAVGDVGVVAELLGGNSVVIAGSLPQRIPSCLHVLSKFLTSPGAVYSSIVPADKKKYGSDGKEDLLKIVCHVLGVKDSSTLDSDTTLGDLGMDSLMAVEIRQALEREFDMVLSAQEVRCLKIGDIEQLGASRKSKTLEGSSCSRKGSRTVVSLPLSLSPVEEFFTPLNEGEGGKAIFFFGPVTGGFYSLTPFASNIQRPLLGVNWTRELDKFGSLEQVAKHFVKKLNEEYFDNSYDVAGYSFGGLIALLVAQELKEKMRRLVLIDSPGRLVKATHDSSLDIFSSWLLNRKVKEGEIESLDSLVEVLSIERSLKVDTSLLQYAFENYKKKCRLVEGFKMEGSVNCESLLIRSSFEVKMSDDQELKKQIPNLKVKKFDGSSFDLLTLNSEPAGSSMDIFCELLSLA